MPKSKQKHHGQIFLILRSIKRAYIPGKFRNEHAVAMLLGGLMGGFFGGVIGTGYGYPGYHTKTWVVVLCTFIGIIVGMGVWLSIVPVRKSKR